MSNQLREIGEFVVFENPQLHDLQETGLMVAHQSVQQGQLYEVGLMVAHSSNTSFYADLREMGLMILHDARAPTPEASLREIGLMVLHSTPTLRGQKLQSYAVSNFIGRQGSQLKKTSGQIS